MKQRHSIIVIPGIFKREGFLERLKNLGQQYNCEVTIFTVPWVGKNCYQLSYKKLQKIIKNKIAQGFTVSLIGTSAGASLAKTIFADAHLEVKRLVTICGPVQDASTCFFKIGKSLSPTWKTALSAAAALTNTAKNRQILTIIPSFDELVPLETMFIPQAKILRVSGCEHLYSITQATTVHANKIFKFLL